MKKPLKMHKKVPSAVLAYFPTKHKIEIDFWNMLRSLAKEYPEVVQKRLEWIIFNETLSKYDATYTSKYFNISRKTFHKWYACFDLHNL